MNTKTSVNKQCFAIDNIRYFSKIGYFFKFKAERVQKSNIEREMTSRK